jgi:hypothetical protein
MDGLRDERASPGFHPERSNRIGSRSDECPECNRFVAQGEKSLREAKEDQILMRTSRHR